MEKRYQVFVSSTFADLKDERQKVIQTLMEMDCIPSGMELFPAIDDEQWEFIKKVIDDCDYYLLIIGGRYGSVTPEGISYTEKEFDYAIGKGIKVIALVHEDPDSIPTGKTDKNPDLADKLKQFRAKVQDRRLVKYWKETKDIPGIVALSLQKTIKAYPAIGWVRADKVSNEELLAEINELRKQNSELTKALADIEPNIFTGSEEKDFLYIYNKLNRFEDINVITLEKGTTKIIKEEKYTFKLASLIPFLSTSNNEYHKIYISHLIEDIIFQTQLENERKTVQGINDITNELLMYGILTKNYVPPVSVSQSGVRGLTSQIKGDKYKLIYSEKLERYKYWLDVTGKMPEHIEIIKKDS